MPGLRKGSPGWATDENQIAHLLANRSGKLIRGSLIRAVRVYLVA